MVSQAPGVCSVLVEFKKRSDAERAKRELDQAQRDSYCFRIVWGNSAEESRAQLNSVHIRFSSPDLEVFSPPSLPLIYPAAILMLHSFVPIPC